MLQKGPIGIKAWPLGRVLRIGSGRGYRLSYSHPSHALTQIRNQTSSIRDPSNKTTAKSSASPRASKQLPSAKYDGGLYVSNSIRSPSSQELVRSLIQAGTVKEIYRAPKQLAYRMTGWCVGGTLISLAGLWAHDLETYADVEHLAMWVRAVYSTVCMAFAFIGTYAALRRRGLIKNISVIPHDNSLFLRVGVRTPLPWVRPKILTIRPAEMTIRGQSNQSTKLPIPNDGLERSFVTKGHLSWIRYSFRRYFTDDGFNSVRIENSVGRYKSYKLDAHGTFEDNGLILYKLVHSKRFDRRV